MNKAAVLLLCSTLNIRKWAVNPRIYAIAFLITAYLYSVIRPVKHFSRVVNVPVNPVIYPFLYSNRFNVLFIMVGCILLFCDAPFIDAMHPYIVIRAGRKKWFSAQILYIFMAVAIYFLFVFAVSVVMLIPAIDWRTDWGTVLGTLAKTDAGRQFGIDSIFFSERVMSLYTPVTAMLWSFLLCWLAGCFLALILFICNLKFNRIVGAVVSNLFVLLTLFCYDFGGHGIFYFSPVSWVDLAIIDPLSSSYKPSRAYALIVLVVSVALLVFFSYRMVRKHDVEVLPPL